MEAIINRQADIFSKIKQLQVNFGKDSASRKTEEYLKAKVELLDSLWDEYNQNHELIKKNPEGAGNYFETNIFQSCYDVYQSFRSRILAFDRTDSSNKIEKSTQPNGQIDELLSLQRTHFRAFYRIVKSIDVNSISEQWEIQDELRNIQSRWNTIDEIHLKIDNILAGGDISYESEFIEHETFYKNIKRQLNQKLLSTKHIQQSVPQLEIPTYSGKITQWPTFFDLFSEAIHNNNSISKAQKMQHLKGKVRGEAERLIQHLHISAENYDTAWDILVHRYNNPQVLFSNQIEVFLNQHSISKQSSFELKRLYDTTTECIHAIHNLGVDTTTWDPLLVHLLCKKLDPVTYSDYKESRKSPRDLPTLEELLSFLESKFTALEPLYKNEKEPPSVANNNNFKRNTNQQKMFNSKPYYQANKNYQSTAAYTSKCVVCNLQHDLFKCRKFLSMSPEAKLRLIAKYRVCQNCLYKHYERECTSTKRCKECNSDHNTLLHEAYARSAPAVTGSSTRTQPNTSTTVASPTQNKHVNVNHIASDDEEVLLTTLSLKVSSADGTLVRLRALLDQGSQVSLITENAAQLLGLPRQRFHASVSGIGPDTKHSKSMVMLNCHSIYEDYQFDTQALVISRVINNLPNSSFAKKSWPHLQHINLADPDYNISSPIDLLLDASVYSNIIMSGLIKGPTQAPIAQNTRMGWIISGCVKTFKCHVIINELADLSKYWELESIGNLSSNLTEAEQYCEDFYQNTTRRLSNGVYEVGLPMVSDYENRLGASKSRAIAQFKQLENKMSKNQSFGEKYQRFIDEYQKLGHMREVTCNSQHPNSYYLPHHGVEKPDSSTTSLRVVFNASQKTSSGNSLNDLMHSGPNLQRDLLSLIIRWRTHKYVLTADIEKMFRQIRVRECDQHLQAIVWRNSPHELLREYYLTTLTYGMKISSFIAMRTLQQLSKDEANKYPLAAPVVATSFYMDELLSGQNSISEAKDLLHQLIKMLQSAGMNLRKWSSNAPELLQDLNLDQLNSPFEFKCSESRKTLGLKWNPSSDSFTFHNHLTFHNTESITKRQLLSDISKIFDPLGWLSPLTIRAKTLFQEAWNSGLEWDQVLPTNMLSKWLQIKEDLKNIDKFLIQRYIGNTQNLYQLHGFCDSSDKSYACVIYARTKEDNTLTLIAAKTKLVPVAKKQSLPRLELCGAVLLSQLMEKVLGCLSNQNISVHAWTDSMIVLGWLHGEVTRWKPFVANRVKQINNIIPSSCWHHVRSEDNAADCATRGLTTDQLQNYSLWWEGPKWLRNFDIKQINIKNYQSPNIEVKKANVHATLQENNYTFIMDLLHKHSSLTRIVNIVGWVSRFLARSRDKRYVIVHGDSLSSAEIIHAYNLIIKDVQMQDFKDDISHIQKKGYVHTTSKLSSLNPFIDEHGLLRVGGRLQHSNLNDSAKHPIILSNHSRFTDLFINQAHITTLHGGPRLTLSFIRNKYWIISGIRTVKRQLRLCVKCRRFNPENRNQIMADAPQARVSPSRCFSCVSIDFTGHVELKANQGRGIRTVKGYIAVFVCLSTKAIHLELVSDLSTPAFLAAFRRFCARRGTPNHVYSDNGRNFVGANRLLKKEYLEIMQFITDTQCINHMSQMDIEWHFNAPAWPSAGGLWEAAVKSLKYHLKRVLGEQKLTYEEFTTLLYQIEACLNSRPLCPLTENPEDDYLTPGHFLVGGPLLSRSQTEPNSTTLSRRWQLVQAMNKQFWKRWSAEYLQQLQVRSKWRTPRKNLEIDDIVLIKEDNMPPGKWALGRVVELHPGRDGHVRVVSLKTCNSIIKRPIIKLALLPTKETETTYTNLTADPQSSSLSNQNADEENITPRSRRFMKRHINFKNFFLNVLLLFTIFANPSVQQSPEQLSLSYNISTLNDNQGLLFDKISDLQYVKDDWKLIVYYNMTTYFQGISNIKNYIKRLKELCYSDLEQYQNIILHLQHEISEIEHYNILLRNHGSLRQKRGLLNGVGYLANTLFGVLDERFAEQYKEDIEKIVGNENYLQLLLKNQTSILESEYNILQRNDEMMKKQFSTVYQRIRTISQALSKVRDGFQLTSSLIEANIMLSHLRRIQQTLTDTVTDITHGHIDTQLLLPEQLQNQLNFISGQLHGDLTLPVDSENIKDLYKLLKVAARTVSNYLIIEIRIPLISKDMFELNRIITIPLNRNNTSYRITPLQPYLAYSIEKDSAFLISDKDIQSCIHVSNYKILCSLDMPIYDLKIKQSFCDISVVDTNRRTACMTEKSPCQNQWTKLHHDNDWLYSCCASCSVRIICTAGITMHQLSGNGIITIGKGCTLKGDSFTLHAHNNFFKSLYIQPDITTHKLSILNSIINTTVPETNFEPSPRQDERELEQLRRQLDELKTQELTPISTHDIHHYTLIYSIIGIIMLIAITNICLRIRQRSRRNAAQTGPTPGATPEQSTTAHPAPSSSVSEMVNLGSDVLKKSVTSVCSVDVGTSPAPLRRQND